MAIFVQSSVLPELSQFSSSRSHQRQGYANTLRQMARLWPEQAEDMCSVATKIEQLALVHERGAQVSWIRNLLTEIGLSIQESNSASPDLITLMQIMEDL